jgi:hypothetical protein
MQQPCKLKKRVQFLHGAVKKVSKTLDIVISTCYNYINKLKEITMSKKTFKNWDHLVNKSRHKSIDFSLYDYYYNDDNPDKIRGGSIFSTSYTLPEKMRKEQEITEKQEYMIEFPT